MGVVWVVSMRILVYKYLINVWVAKSRDSAEGHFFFLVGYLFLLFGHLADFCIL